MACLSAGADEDRNHLNMNASTLAHVIQQVISSQEDLDAMSEEIARLRDEVDRLNSLLHPRSEPECQEMTEDEAHEHRDW